MGRGRRAAPHFLPFPSEVPGSPQCRFCHEPLVTRWLRRAGWGPVFLMNARRSVTVQAPSACASPRPLCGRRSHDAQRLPPHGWGLRLSSAPRLLPAPWRVQGGRAASCLLRGRSAGEVTRGSGAPDPHGGRQRGRLAHALGEAAAPHSRLGPVRRCPPTPRPRAASSLSGPDRKLPLRGRGWSARTRVPGAPAVSGPEPSEALGAAAALGPEAEAWAGGQVGWRRTHLPQRAAHARGAAGSQGSGEGPWGATQEKPGSSFQP